MADFDRFEHALGTALRLDADSGAIPFDPRQIASVAIERSTRGRLEPIRRAITSPQVRWLLAAALLVAALVAILLSAGQRSPSGRLLALRGGHVLSIDVASGHEAVLYDGSDAVGVSPDGKWIERGPLSPLETVDMVAIDGRRVTLPHDIGAPWSWDGHYTTVTDLSAQGAWTTILDTRDMHRYQVTLSTPDVDWGWDVDPLGRGIVVALGDSPTADEADPEPGAVLWWVPTSAAGAARQLTVGPERAESPSISPDGRLLAYVVFACKNVGTPILTRPDCQTGTHVLDLETNEDRVVGRGRENPFTFGLVPSGWSPDSRWLALAFDGKLGVLDVAADRVRALSIGSPSLSLSGVTWSPDSRFFVFTRTNIGSLGHLDDPTHGNSEVYLSALDLRIPARLLWTNPRVLDAGGNITTTGDTTVVGWLP